MRIGRRRLFGQLDLTQKELGLGGISGDVLFSGGACGNLQALEYDYEAAARAMEATGLTDGYGEALLSGLWPSEDVLPARERSQRGRALSFKPFTFSP